MSVQFGAPSFYCALPNHDGHGAQGTQAETVQTQAVFAHAGHDHGGHTGHIIEGFGFVGAALLAVAALRIRARLKANKNAQATDRFEKNDKTGTEGDKK